MNPPPPQRIGSWRDAEANTAAWMRHWGFIDAAVTPGGNDGGVDVRSATAIAQVKREATDVGIEALQRLAGARLREHHLGLFFFSGSGYTRQALRYAEAMGMMLFVYEVDGTMVAVSSEARGLIEQRQRVERQSTPAPGRAAPATTPSRSPETTVAESPLIVGSLRPVSDFPEVMALIWQGKRDKAVDAYSAAAGVKPRQAKQIVSSAWAAVTLMPPGRRGRFAAGPTRPRP